MSCTRFCVRAQIVRVGFIVLVVAAAVVAVMGITGCGALGGGSHGTGPGQEPPPTAGVIRQQLDDTQARLDAERAAQEQALAQAQQAGDVAAQQRAQASIDATQEAARWLGQARALVVVDDSGNLDPAGSAGAAAALLPPPWNIVGLIGLPLIAGAVGEWRRKKALADAKSIVNHVDVLMTKDERVKNALKSVSAEAKAAAHEQLTPGAKALIDAESVT